MLNDKKIEIQEQLNNATKTTQTTEVSETLTIENCAPVSAKLDIKNGKTIQEGEPSPDNIIPIRNVGDNINLVNLGNETFTRIGFSNVANGSEWKISGTSTESNYLRTDFISLGNFKKGNYVLKIDSEITSSSIAFILKNSTNNTTISSTSVQNKVIKFTLEETTELGVNIWNNGIGNVINGTIYLKLEQGSISTPYTPYNAGTMNFQLSNEDNSQSKIASFPFTAGQRLHIGDYLASDGTHHKRKTLILKGTEELWAKEQTSTHIRFSLPIADSKNVGNNRSATILSNYFRPSVIDDYGICFTYGNSIYLYPNAEITTLEQWKAYLAEQYSNGTPVTIEYELAEEIVIPYTPEQEQAYYELQHLLMYEGYTNITCIDEIKPDIQLTYWYNNELNKSYGERFDKVEDSINELEKGEIYSTEEQVIGKWIDGKPLYRKVINFGAIPNNTLKYVKHNISNIKYIKSCNGYAMNSEGAGLIIPSYNGTIYTNCYTTATEVHVKTNGDRSSFTTCYITLEYTKTTD